VLNHILDLHKKGHTIIITTHDLEKVVAHAQRLVVMAKGRIVQDGMPAEVINGIERYGLRPPCSVQLGRGIRPWVN
jgi:energy-coupling factor transporter ATP-binding protein EcfA2